MKCFKWIVALALVVPASASFADDKDKMDQKDQDRMTMSDLPAPVQKTVQRESKDKTIGKITKEMEGGKMQYRIELSGGGKATVLVVAADGKMISNEPDKTKKSPDMDKSKSDQP
jgi:hypothetical protein